MNKLLKNEILSLNATPPNIYVRGKDIINGFVKFAAEKQGVDFSTKQVKRMVTTELFYNSNYIGGYTGMKPSTTDGVAFHLCKDKFKLEKHLSMKQIPTFKSEVFYEKNKEQAKEFIKEHNHILFVLKPLSLSGGRGIEFKVDITNFDEAWERSINTQKENNSKPYACILQPFMDGFDLRVTIIEGSFSSALLRLPAHVVGDGKHTIEQLINIKNEIKASSEYFNNKLIEISNPLLKILESQSLSLNDIVKKNDVVHLSYIGNLVAGADSFDVTYEVSEDIKNLAIEATAAIPGLYSSGVDIMTEDFKKGKGVIVEVNTNPNNRMHELPFRGQKRSPSTDYIKALVINQKLKDNERLNSEEIEINSNYQKFLKLKSDYYARFFEVRTVINSK